VKKNTGCLSACHYRATVCRRLAYMSRVCLDGAEVKEMYVCKCRV
jgi:hypothetical protein